MELQAVSQDYGRLTEQVRSFSATRLHEMIEGLRPYVAEALSDPGGIHELEPSRLVAYTQLLKLQASLVKDLGMLYRVHDRPDNEDDDSIPAVTVALMLEEAAMRHAAELAEATQAAETRVREELAASERRTLEYARAQVTGQLARLRQR